MDLGRKQESPEVATVAAQSESKEPKIHYPSVTLNDEAAKAFCKAHECEMGTEYCGTLKFKVTGKRDDSYGSSVTLDIMDIDDVAEEHTEGSEKPKSDEKPADESKPADDSSDKDEEKILGYKRKKSGDSGKEKIKASPSFMDTP